MARSILLFGLVTSAIALAWFLVGRPVPVPASPLGVGQRLNCLSYAPFHGADGPFTQSLRIPDEQIADDLRQLAEVTPCIRTYSAAGVQGKITRIADGLGLKVLQGIWIGRNLADNRREIEAALRLTRQHPSAVQALIVGNEVLLRGELGTDRLISYLGEVRRRSGLPVTYADVWEFWLRASELAPAVDFITIHILPYWEDQPVKAEDAVEHVREVRDRVVKTFGGKEIWIGEVGWPSEGRMRQGALPSRANQALVLEGVVEAAKEGGWKINLIEAFDQPWKRLLEGTVGGYWGVFDDGARAQKFHWGEPVSNYPEWRLQAGLGIVAAFLVFAAAWFFSRGREVSWTHSLGVAAIALASGIVFGWAVTGLPMEPPEPGDRLRSALMIALSLIVPITAGAAVVRGVGLGGAEIALNKPLRERGGGLAVLLSLLFAATLVAAIHVALGLVFDPRYKDFQLALLSGPVTALAILALLGTPRPSPGMAERVACGLLTAAGLFVIYNEGIANWQALWFGVLLAILALTALRTSPVPG